MNHRLNVFGFLDLSQIGGEPYASSANVGMLDLVLALQWVRDNIAGFGGDPGNVTIFGQSGGGRKVSTLLGMPLAKGLFHKAAVLSGSHLRQILPDASTRLASGVLDVLGITKADLAKIHQVPTDQLLNAGIEAQRRSAQGAAAATPALAWGPVVDGRVIPAHTFDPTPSPLALDVPMLIGNTYAEFGGGANNPTANVMTTEQMRERLTPTLGAKTGEIVDAYQRTFPNAKPFEIYGVIVGHAGVSDKRGHAGGTEGGAKGRARLHVLVRLEDAGARRTAARVSLSGPGVLVRQHRSRGAGHRRR